MADWAKGKGDRGRRIAAASVLPNGKVATAADALVHGGFADGSGWRPVNDILTRDEARPQHSRRAISCMS